ncbi:MAG TPA: ABC transporter permease [Bryobacteraceae bacterium]|jgi:predicted permease|nr:ABC transporter permease [Bryobacteraceae bacterium]
MPDWKAAIRQQLAELKLAPAREAEIVEELAAHAQDRSAELIGGGATEADACRIALDELSGHQLLARELRGVERANAHEPAVLGAPQRGTMLAGLRQDLRYGLRTLRKNPGFTAVAILALALGIGANTAIFSVVNGVLLRPLGYPDPARLLLIFETTAEFSQSTVAYPNYLDWRRASRSFTNMGAYRNDDLNFTGAGEPEHLAGEYVSASLFPTLGAATFMGRSFLPEEDRQESACAVMLSYGFWKGRLAADPKILGKALTLNAVSCNVVGVLPGDFHFRDGIQVYLPIEQWKSIELRNREVHAGLRVVGRLKPGANMASAQAEMSSLSAVLASQYPKTNAGHGVNVIGMKDDLVGNIRATLLLLAGAVGFVLIIACANVANLLLARSTARKREFAIRAALGAARGRIVRQLLTESVLLSMGGAAVGLLLARWGTSLVLAAAPGTLPRSSEIGIDWHVLLFTLVVSIATGVLFGLSPAWLGANADPQESLKEGTRGAGGGRHRAEGIFVTVEVGLAVILLAGAGLMIESVWRLLQISPGFNTHNVLTMQVALSPKVMANGPAIRLAYQQLLGRVAAVPGAQSVAMASLVPLSDDENEIPLWLGAGPQPAQDQMTLAMFYIVTPDYPRVMQIPLRRGRFFTEQDSLASATVVVVDEVFARHLLPSQDPIGKQISLPELGPARIVGVVGHVKHSGLDSDDTAKVRDQIYFPFMQVPDKFMAGGAVGLTLLIRTRPEPLSLLSAVRAQVAGPTEDQPIYAVNTIEQNISASLAERRFTMLLLIIFAATALLLAEVGIYGVMSYAVTRRAHELGIRLALGATRREILGIVLTQGMRLAAIGMAAGLAAATALTRLLASLLYGVRPADPATMAAVALLLGGIALLACYIPARRATAVDPVVALRCE